MFDSEHSIYGDCIKIVDLPDEARVDPDLPPFGWNSEPALGGYATITSALSGDVLLEFGPEKDGHIPIQIELEPQLVGKPAMLSTPGGYQISAENNRVRNVRPISSGLLEVRTGRIFAFNLNLMFKNTAIDKLTAVNRNIHTPPLYFPGVPNSGHAIGWIETVEEEGLALNILAGLFLPLDAQHKGDPVKMPQSEAGGSCTGKSFPAANSSLHPYLRLRACSVGPPQTVSASPATAPNASLYALENTKRRLRLRPDRSFYGDEFTLNNDRFGGAAEAQCPLFGDLTVQFGRIEGGRMPMVFGFEAPSNRFAQAQQKVISVFPPGLQPGPVGIPVFCDSPNCHIGRPILCSWATHTRYQLGMLGLRTVS